jgi:hypothetical protein
VHDEYDYEWPKKPADYLKLLAMKDKRVVKMQTYSEPRAENAEQFDTLGIEIFFASETISFGNTSTSDCSTAEFSVKNSISWLFGQDYDRKQSVAGVKVFRSTQFGST